MSISVILPGLAKLLMMLQHYMRAITFVFVCKFAFVVAPLSQFVWEGSDHLGEASSILTGIFFKHYTSPYPFNYDVIGVKGEKLTDLPKGVPRERHVHTVLKLILM